MNKKINTMGNKYNFAYFDEGSKQEIRRAILKAIAIPGYQVPFASREMPIGRGWGTGGLQLTLSLIGRDVGDSVMVSLMVLRIICNNHTPPRGAAQPASRWPRKA